MRIYSTRTANTKGKTEDPRWAYLKYKKMELTLSQITDLVSRRIQALKYLDERIALNKPLSANDVVERLKNWEIFESTAEEVVSHFFVRLGYCGSRERREWLIMQEKRLFEVRWERATARDRKIILRQLNADKDYQEVTKEMACTLELSGKFPIHNFNMNGEHPNDAKTFPIQRIRFELVPDLVGRKDVLIQDGFALVPDHLFKTFVSGRFRAHLAKALVQAYKEYTQKPERHISRLTPLVKSMQSISSGPVYSVKDGEKLRLRDLKAARNLFPPCMRVMEKQLRTDNHLKHHGRLIYGKFLKSCGMSCDDQITYYRRHFTKKMSAEKFNKEYKYNIRHHYGLEGKKQDYKALGCFSICSNPVGAGEYHGCPFRTFDKNNLTKLMREMRVSDTGIKGIIEKTEGQHYTLACRDAFMHTFKKGLAEKGLEIERVANNWAHPNGYYEAAKALYDEKKTEDGKVDAFSKMQIG